MKTLITADHVLAHDGTGMVELRDGAVLVDGDTISYVGTRADAPTASVDDRIELGASLLTPGLIDLDALADIDHLILDSWSTPESAARLRWSLDYATARRHHVFTAAERATVRRYALVQLALRGITSYLPIASEVHSEWAESADDFIELARISRELGLRGFLGPSYRSGVNVVRADGTSEIYFDEDAGERGFADAVRFLDHVEALADPLTTGVLAPCRVETVRPELLSRTAREAAERGVLVRVHALQGLAERRALHELYGTTPLDLLHDTGLLNQRLIIAHGIYLDRDPRVFGQDRGDLARTAAAGASIIHCPLTNGRYASVLHDLSAYLDAGVNVALGTDSFPPDLIRGIDAGSQLAKAQHDDTSHGMLAEYFEAATLGGATALHRPDLGRIAVGATADLAAFRLDELATGPVEDPVRTLVLNGTARDAVLTMVAGRVVMRDGVVPGVDLESLRVEGQRLFDTMRAAYGERDYLGGTGELFPPVFPVVG